MILKPLKNPLENRPTVLRVYRSLYSELTLTNKQWSILSKKIYDTYKSITDEPLKKVNQKRLFGESKYRKKVNCYPIEFIPVIINIIKDFKG